MDCVLIESSQMMYQWDVFRNVPINLQCKLKHFHVFRGAGIFVTEDDEVYSTGSNNYGKLGIGSEVASVNSPNIIKELSGKQVIEFSSGSCFVMALTQDGEVYSFGWAEKGRSGTGTSENCLRSPVKIASLSGVHIVQISCGGSHTLALSRDGEVFAWGDNQYYQTGRQGVEPVQTPQMVIFPPGVIITSVSAGYQHSAALSSTGQVYTWGDNSSGQLGEVHQDVKVWKPSLVKCLLEETIIQVSARNGATAFLTISGSVYITRKRSDPEKLIVTELVPELPRAIRIISHWDNTYTLIETCDGVYQLGSYSNNIWDLKKLEFDMKEALYNMYVRCVKVRKMATQRRDGKFNEDYSCDYDNSENCDVILQVDERRLNAHTSILNSKCPHLINIINRHGMKQDSNIRLVRISGYSADAYFMFIKYLYTGRLDSAGTASDLLELVAIASKYCDLGLVTLARKRLMEEQLTPDNSSILYQKAQLLNLVDIQDEIVVKMCTLVDQIIMSVGYMTIDSTIARSMTFRMMSCRYNEDKSTKPTADYP